MFTPEYPVLSFSFHIVRRAGKIHQADYRNTRRFLLQQAVSGPRDYGRGTITRNDIDKLITNYEKTNSWILFDEELDENSIPLDKWKVKSTEDTTQNPGRLHKNR